METDADQTTCHDNIQEEDISYVNFEESTVSSENNGVQEGNTANSKIILNMYYERSNHLHPLTFMLSTDTPCHIVIDTGATSSLISKSFLNLAGITTKPTFHSINIQFGNMNLPITALVVTSLDCDILGGVPFCRENDIGVHLKDEEFSLHGKRLSYGAKPKQVKNIFRVESVLLRNDTDKVVIPREFIEFEFDLIRRRSYYIGTTCRISTELTLSLHISCYTGKGQDPKFEQ